MPRLSTRFTVGAAIVLGVQAALLAGVLAATGADTPLPVVASFSSAPGAADRGASTALSSMTATVASVDLGWALAAVLLGGAVTFALVALLSGTRTTAKSLSARTGRGHVLLVAGWSQGSAILVFLVAQLNGIAEVSSLVPMYAITAGAVALVGIDRHEAPTWQRPASWAAAVGIVPWGVIAFSQIGAGVTVGVVGVGVRIVTVLALVVAVAGWMLGWRRSLSHAGDVALMTVGVSVVVWTIVAFEVLGGA